MGHGRGGWLIPGVAVLLVMSAPACSAPARSIGPSPSVRPVESPPMDEAGPSPAPVLVGESIDVASLQGRIVFSGGSDDQIYAAAADGSAVVRLTTHPGPEFDPSWSPDGRWIAYRDSRRGINQNDEIFVMRADGTGKRNLTRDPANDWGPAWSPDGSTIAFNSDRDGYPMGGYLMDADGSDVRRIATNAYVEYPTWSPDGTRIAFMGQDPGTNDYDLYVVNVDGTRLVRLTEELGSDGWPAWSPDGRTIAFSSERDDCGLTDAQECGDTGDIGEHHDVWLIEPDGSNLRRVTLEFGQFVEWSPDGRYLLVAGWELYVIRPDGTGRATIPLEGLPDRGLLPDWAQ